MAVTAPKSVIMAKVDSLTLRMVTLSVFFLLIGIGMTILISRNISRPIKEISKYLNTMATGDFTKDMSKTLLTKQDEIGNLANSLSKMQSSMRTMMKAVMDESSNVSQMLISIKKDMYNLNESIEKFPPPQNNYPQEQRKQPPQVKK